MKVITDDIDKYDQNWWNNLYSQWTHGVVEHEEGHYKTISNLIKGKRVLEVGCGMGHFAPYCYSYLGIDWSEEAIKKAKILHPEYNFICANHKDVKEKFDAVCMFEVFEHVENPKKMVEELLEIAPEVYISLPEGEYSKLWVENDRELMEKYNPGATEYHYANYCWDDILEMFPQAEKIPCDNYSILFKVCKNIS